MAPDRPLPRSPVRSPTSAYDRKVVLPSSGGGMGTYYEYGQPSDGWGYPKHPSLPRSPWLQLQSEGLLSGGPHKTRLVHLSCWRLRWCAFSLLLACAAQAAVVGAQLQGYLEQPGGGGGWSCIAGNLSRPSLALSVGLLVILLLSLWVSV